MYLTIFFDEDLVRSLCILSAFSSAIWEEVREERSGSKAASDRHVADAENGPSIVYRDRCNIRR